MTLENLATHRCLHFIAEGRLLQWSFRTGPQAHSVSHAGNLQMDNAEAIRVAAVAGLGIAKLPSYIVADDLRAGRLQAVLSEFAELPEPIRVVYPSRRNMSPKIRNFIDELVTHWSPAPWTTCL
jgi:DNA-binding transcriptional LysR family regulator